MYEISKRRFLVLAVMTAMVFGSVAFQGHTSVATNGDGNTGHVAILQEPGAAGHTQIAFFGANGTSGCGHLVYSDNQSTGNIAVLSAKASAIYNGPTMAAILRQAQIQARAGTGTIYNYGTMALMRETWQTGGRAVASHRLAQALQAHVGHQAVQQAAHREESYSRLA